MNSTHTPVPRAALVGLWLSVSFLGCANVSPGSFIKLPPALTRSSDTPPAQPVTAPKPEPKEAEPPPELVAWIHSEPGSVIYDWTHNGRPPESDKAKALLAQRDALKAFADGCKAKGYLGSWRNLNGTRLCEQAGDVEARVHELARHKVEQAEGEGGIADSLSRSVLADEQKSVDSIMHPWLRLNDLDTLDQTWLDLAGVSHEQLKAAVSARFEPTKKKFLEHLGPAKSTNDDASLRPAFEEHLRQMVDSKAYRGPPGKIVALNKLGEEINRGPTGLVLGKPIFTELIVKDSAPALLHGPPRLALLRERERRVPEEALGGELRALDPRAALPVIG